MGNPGIFRNTLIDRGSDITGNTLVLPESTARRYTLTLINGKPAVLPYRVSKCFPIADSLRVADSLRIGIGKRLSFTMSIRLSKRLG